MRPGQEQQQAKKSPSQAIRLNKFLAERLGVSRRQADELIKKSKITINGKPAVIGDRVDRNDKVCYNREIIPFSFSYIYLAMNKPVGYVCSRRQQGEFPTIYQLLPKKYQDLKTVGRLDKDSSGIILLTNDGDFAFEMTHPKFIKEKIYEVELDRPLEPLHQQMISDFGIDLEDGKSKLGLEKITADRKKWKVFMSEGRNRQIRRTFAAVGYKIVSLHRVQFGKYQLGTLPSGKFVSFAKP